MLDAAYFPHLVDFVFGYADHTGLLALRRASRAFRERADRTMAKHLCLSSADEVVSKRFGCELRHPAFMPSAPDQPTGARYLPASIQARLLKHTSSLTITGVPDSPLLGLISHLPPTAIVHVCPAPLEHPAAPFTPTPTLPSTKGSLVWTCDMSAGPTLTPPRHTSKVIFDVICGPRSLHSAFHFPEADQYVVRFRGPRAPTVVTESVLGYILGRMMVGKRARGGVGVLVGEMRQEAVAEEGVRWTFIDTQELRVMLEDLVGQDVVDLRRGIEGALYAQFRDGTTEERRRGVREVMRRVDVVSAQAYCARGGASGLELDWE